MDVADVTKELFPSDDLVSFGARLVDLCNMVRTFAEERDWARFHTPRNLVLALIGEMGELAELLQFRGDADEDVSWTRETHDKFGQEIADVSIYLIRLATVCDMELHVELSKLTED